MVRFVIIFNKALCMYVCTAATGLKSNSFDSIDWHIHHSVYYLWNFVSAFVAVMSKAAMRRTATTQRFCDDVNQKAFNSDENGTRDGQRESLGARSWRPTQGTGRLCDTVGRIATVSNNDDVGSSARKA